MSDYLQAAIDCCQKINRRDYAKGVEGQTAMLIEFQDSLKPLTPRQIKVALGTLRPESNRMIQQWLGGKPEHEADGYSKRGNHKWREYGW